MKCPHCRHLKDRVLDSRAVNDNQSVRRRRECMRCKKRYTTYESIELVSIVVVKRDDRRESFDRNKIQAGILKACEKRPVTAKQIETMVERVEKELQKNYDREVNASHIGELIMAELQRVDEVAYIRFASVYRQFKDINHFMAELKGLLSQKK